MSDNDRPWLITGAAGYLGSQVVRQLIARGLRVVGVDNLSGGRPENIQSHDPACFILEQIDIRDQPTLETCMRKHRPAVVVHLAALHFIPAAIADPSRAVSINVHGTQCVLQASRSADVPRFWFASTGDVYAPAATPHSEDAPLRPFN